MPRRVEDSSRSDAERLPDGAGGAGDLAQLQSKAGNRAVASLLARTDKVAPTQAAGQAEDMPSKQGFVVPETAPPPRTGGTKIPAQLRTEMEGSFGAGFGQVKVHQDEEMADELGSVAFTVGNDVHFGPGNYQPHSGSGRQVIAHELTHVLQQRSGRVDSPDGDGLAVNTEPNLESEADRLGRHAAWRLPVRVKGLKSGTRKPVDVTAQADQAHSPLRSSPAE